MSFEEAAARFAKTQPPKELNEWVSPYRLLFGAAYSIGKAEPLIPRGDVGDIIPMDLSPYLQPAVDRAELPWLPKWEASYLLTNAIFRVAAAAEKICSLVEPRLQEDRRELWKAVKQPTTAFSRKLPQAYEVLGGTSDRKQRKAHLQKQRDDFPASLTIARPLICALMQTDRDKHVAYSPSKELGFERALATTAFLETCDLWDAAVAAMKPSSA